jgi:hypothetical protein
LKKETSEPRVEEGVENERGARIIQRRKRENKREKKKFTIRKESVGGGITTKSEKRTISTIRDGSEQ